MARLRVGVIFGSRSVEHAVSIITAHQVMGALDRARYEVVPIYIGHDGGWFTGEALLRLGSFRRLETAGLERIAILPDPGVRGLVSKPGRPRWFGRPILPPLDVAFPVVHGTHGEDGTLQGLLELADLPYVGAGVVGSAVGMDKIIMKSVFRDSGLPVVEYRGFTRREWQESPDEIIARVEADLEYPVFVKPANLGSSVGISRARDKEGLRFALEVAAHYDRRLIVERAVDRAREINCAVLGNAEPMPSVCEEPVPWEEFLSYEDKYLRKGGAEGMKGMARRIPAPIPADLTAEIQGMAVRAFRAIDCRGIARVDFLVDPGRGRAFVNEINTMPGSVAFYLWEPLGIRLPELCDRLIALALEVHEEKRKTLFTSDQDAALLGKLEDLRPAKGS